MSYIRFRITLVLTVLLAITSARAESTPDGHVSPGDAANAASELGELLRDNYLFPDIGIKYAEALEARVDDGTYSEGIDLADFARDLETVVNKVHRDAHLRVNARGVSHDGQRRMRRPHGSHSAVGETAWIDGDVAYVELQGLPSDEASQKAMADFLDRYRGARALIVDARMCPGGSLPVIDVLNSRLYDKPMHLVTMDIRTDASDPLEQNFEALPSMRRVESESTITRFEHWVTPSSNEDDRAWAYVPVYYLTNMTASACEHLALSLKITDRATLIGNTTRGAGHFGGMSSFADDSLQVFLPVGRTYDPATGWDWEGSGIEPDIAVPADQALKTALKELGVDPSLASSVTPQRGRSPAVAVRTVNNGDQPSYGLGIMPPRGGDTFIEVMMVVPDGVAANAGLQQGDRIVAMNGKNIADLNEDSIVKALRSPRLDLEITRGGEKSEVQLSSE